MSNRLYDRLAMLFCVLGIASALLFRPESPWRWFCGAVGLLAGAGVIFIWLGLYGQIQNSTNPV